MWRLIAYYLRLQYSLTSPVETYKTNSFEPHPSSVLCVILKIKKLPLPVSSYSYLPGGDGNTPLGLALRRQRQKDICEFEASLVYRASSRTGSKATKRNPVSKHQTTKQTPRNKNFKKPSHGSCFCVFVCFVLSMVRLAY